MRKRVNLRENDIDISIRGKTVYWAIDKDGESIYVDDAIKGIQYYCPICTSPMILKAGPIIARHYAHKTCVSCDKWYDSKGKSPWHKYHQELFPAECREVTVFDNEDKSKFHVADVLFEREGKGNMVVEFQHSSIPVKEFKERTEFYQNNPCRKINGKPVLNTVVWVFDFTEKKIFFDDIEERPGWLQGYWPGNDRIRFLGNYIGSDNVYIIMHVIRNKYEIQERSFDGISYNKYVHIPDPNKRDIYIDIYESEDDYRLFKGIRIPANAIERYVRYCI